MIIKSLLDNDLYKFTMGQLVFHRFPEVEAGYTFRDRGGYFDFRPFLRELQAEVEDYCSLSFARDEMAYLKSLGLFSQDYLDFLKTYKPQRNAVQMSLDENGGLRLAILGNWAEVIFFEVPLLAIISELASRELGTEDEGERRLRQKVEILKSDNCGEFLFTDFGTRRRYSGQWQARVVEELHDRVPAHLAGTSNVHLAKTLGLKAVGTMGHELLQGYQALTDLRQSQRAALKDWLAEFGLGLSVALTDCLSLDAFLADFDGELAASYRGLRQDSGDPRVWAEKVIRHYRGLGLDPGTKTAVFSDHLDVESALKLHREFQGRLDTSFGIGTSLTNDLGPTPRQIVIKMSLCDGKPVAKLTDDPDKEMGGTPEYRGHLREVFGIPRRDLVLNKR